MRRFFASVKAHYVDDVLFMFDRVMSRLIDLSDVKKHIARMAFNRTKQFNFMQDYASFLLTTTDSYACRSIIEGVELSKDDPIKKKVAQSILDGLDQGKKASFGMKPWFDRDILDLYQAGESSGDIKSVLNLFIAQEGAVRKFKAEFIGKFIAPGYILAVGIVTAFALGKSDFMGFTRFSDPVKWEGVSKNAYAISSFVHSNILFIMLGLVFCVITFQKVAPTWSGKLRKVADRYPPFNIYKAFQGLSVIQLISIIKSTSASDMKAISIAHKNSNPYIKSFTSAMLGELDLGETLLARAVDTGLFPPRLMSRLYSVSRIPDDDSKIRALLLVSEQAELEAKLQLAKTRSWAIWFTWLTAVALTGTMIIGFAMVILNTTPT